MAKKANKSVEHPESNTQSEESKPKRQASKKRSFPIVPFQDCFEFASSIHEIGAGQKVRRLTLFEKIGRSPDSSASRLIITNSSKYGLTKGNYASDHLELTDLGKVATSDDYDSQRRLAAKFELAIKTIPIYDKLYERFKENKIPNHSVIIDLLKESEPGLDAQELEAVVNTFVVNVKSLGLIREIAGALRIISIEQAFESLEVQIERRTYPSDIQSIDLVQVGARNNIQFYEPFDNICFYITPIGSEGSEQRKHSDLFLESIVEPAIQLLHLNLQVVRADQIEKPGTITRQIIEYIYKAKIVIADLSYHNPNVFYELALRHAFRLPTVQLIRKADIIPFDLNQTRTIMIDTTDIYSLVPKIEVYKAEIASQVKQALQDPDSVDNPITNVFPGLQIRIS